MGEQKLKPKLKPSVTQYHDYREYLTHLLDHFKLEKGISIRALSKTIGVSHGYFSLVLSGKRNLSSKVVDKLLPEIDLDPKEEKYFRNIILIGDGRTAKVRNKAIKDLKLSKDYKDNHPKEFETHKYLEKWYYIAIRELSLTKDFKADPRWIKSQLPFSIHIHNIEKAIDFLIQHNFLKRSGLGELEPTERSIQCVGGVFRLSLTNYHLQMLDLAKTAIDIYEPQQRKQIGYTMALPQAQLDEAKAILEDAMAKLKKLEVKHKKESDTVYHVNLSAFPIAGSGCKK